MHKPRSVFSTQFILRVFAILVKQNSIGVVWWSIIQIKKESQLPWALLFRWYFDVKSVVFRTQNPMLFGGKFRRFCVLDLIVFGVKFDSFLVGNWGCFGALNLCFQHRKGRKTGRLTERKIASKSDQSISLSTGLSVY